MDQRPFNARHTCRRREALPDLHLQSALTDDVLLERLAEAVEADEREYGPVPDEVLAEVDANWPGSTLVKRVLTLIMALLGLVFASTASAADPITCEGYPQPRVLYESQSGWSDAEGSTYGAAEHVHSGACFPYLKTVSGSVQFDVVTKLHNSWGHYLRKVRVQGASSQDGARTLSEVDFRGTRQCLVADCTFVTSLTVDTDSLAAGRWEFRIHSDSRRTPDTLAPSNLSTNGWLVCIRDCAGGRTPQAVSWPATEGRGWYKPKRGRVKGYISPRFMEQLPSTVSGTWCPLVRIVPGSNEGQNPVDRSFATIDPHFHAVPEDPGRVLLDQVGEFRNQRICVDTTTLVNGSHKLMLRAYGTSGYSGEQWGAMVVSFNVQNP